MDKQDLRIVFMGTPDFAVESLRVLVENKYNIVGVVTMPDKPSGRGHKMQYSSVKKYALEQNLPLLQPEKLKDDVFLKDLKAWGADLQIVVAFRMLPELVWNMPRLGTFNLHGSLLPQYRGAAPINWAIINGEKKTGVTTFFLVHEIDMGSIVLQSEIEIKDEDNAGTIHDELMLLGASLVKDTVDLVLENKIETIDQDVLARKASALNPAPKIFKETCRIDWENDMTKIHDQIRGLSPYPSAWTEMLTSLDTISPVKILETKKIDEAHNLSIGTIRTDNKNYLHIACRNGFIDILKLQLPGRKAMPTQDLLRGFQIEADSIFK